MFTRIFLCLAAITLTAALGFAQSQDDQTIQVGLFYGARAPEPLVISGVGEVRGAEGKISFDGEVRVKALGGRIVLEHKGKRLHDGEWVEFAPTGKEPWLDLANASYRGKLRIDVVNGDRLRVINIVAMEDYIRGVVPNEMFAHPSAYKVQAVISRTYASYVRDIEKKHRPDGFDICTTGHCQVYRGLDSETPMSNQAVEETQGEVLTFQGKPIFSAYHSNAGGVTQTVDEAWPGSIRANFPYLTKVDSPFDAEAEALPGFAWCYRWECEINPKDIAERLRARGKEVGEVKDLVVKARTSTGRVKELEVVGTRDRAILKTQNELRAILVTPSDRMEIAKRGNCFKATGWGCGHGVGLSQHGALGMARAGYSYEQILGHFYRGVYLTEDYGRGESRPLSPPEVTIAAPDARPAPSPPGAG